MPIRDLPIETIELTDEFLKLKGHSNYGAAGEQLLLADEVAHRKRRREGKTWKNLYMNFYIARLNLFRDNQRGHAHGGR